MTYINKEECHNQNNNLNKIEEKKQVKHNKNIHDININKALSDGGNINKEKLKKNLCDNKSSKPEIEKNSSSENSLTRSKSEGNYQTIKKYQAQQRKKISEKNKNINKEKKIENKYKERVDLNSYGINYEESNNKFSETKIIFEWKSNFGDIMDIYNNMSYYVRDEPEDFLYKDLI